MDGFLITGKEIPEHCSVFQVRLWISLLGMNKSWKFDAIAYEEDWRIVSDNIPVALFGIKLDRKASRITGRVRRAFLAADR